MPSCNFSIDADQLAQTQYNDLDPPYLLRELHTYPDYAVIAVVAILAYLSLSS